MPTTTLTLSSRDRISFGLNARNTALLLTVTKTDLAAPGMMENLPVEESVVIRMNRKEVERLVAALREELQTGNLPEQSNLEKP